jgi:hypothetical protein
MLSALLFSQAASPETDRLDGGFGNEPVRPDIAIPPAYNRTTKSIQSTSLSRETSNSVTEYDSGLVEFTALARVSCYAMTFTVDSRHIDRADGRT